jgi:hypothetical protein
VIDFLSDPWVVIGGIAVITGFVVTIGMVYVLAVETSKELVRLCLALIRSVKTLRNTP